MLSLGRKSGQYVVIDDNIIVKVEDTKNGLKLFIDAPENVKIVRSEVWEREHPIPECIVGVPKKADKK